MREGAGKGELPTQKYVNGVFVCVCDYPSTDQIIYRCHVHDRSDRDSEQFDQVLELS